jgi:hypothetical protein
MVMPWAVGMPTAPSWLIGGVFGWTCNSTCNAALPDRAPLATSSPGRVLAASVSHP